MEWFLYVNLALFSLLAYKYFNLKHKTNLQIVRIPSFDPSLDLNGVFEIHITIDPSDDYIKLLNYCRAHQNIKPILACSSAKNNQYMISHYTRKTSSNEAIEKAIEMANDMRRAGMDILRIKVEAQNITGITGLPITNEDFANCKNKYLDPYFEFHIKISNAPDYIIDLSKFVTPDVKVAVSYNLLSKNMLPLLTVRIYNSGFLSAQSSKDFILDKLKKDAGYIFADCTQQEFSIYDSNPNLDKGWLI